MTHTITKNNEQRTNYYISCCPKSSCSVSTLQGWFRAMVHSIRINLLILLLTASSALAEPLEITIYAMRSASDLQHKTYTYDYIPYPQSHKDFDLNIVQSGPTGQMSSTFTRGTNSNHTLFALNGMSIKDHSTPTGVDDISQHSLVGVNSVEIIQGPMSTVYGPNAVGGVINMTSYATTDSWVDFSIGSNGLNTQTIKHGDYYGNSLIDFSVERTHTDGISVYPQGAEPDGFTSENYSLRTTHNSGDWWFNTNINSKNNSSDLDDSGADHKDYTSEWQFNNQYIDALNGQSKISYMHVTHDRTYSKSGTQDNYLSESHNILGTHVYNFGLSDLTVGAEHMNTHADFDTAIGGYISSVDQTRHNSAVFAELDLAPKRDLVYTIGARQDWLSEFEDVQTYRLAAAWKGWRTAWATAFKEPTAYEQHGTDSWGFQGNPNLSPEHSQTVELGYRNTWFDAAIYRTEITDLLTYSANTYTNAPGTSVIQGADLSLSHTVDNIRISNSTSYVLARDSSDTQLLRRPEWQNTLDIGYTIDSSQQVALQWNYYGSHQDINSKTWATETQSSISTVDLNWEFYHKQNKKFYANIGNVFDSDYERPNGYNQPGQSLEIGVRIEF